MIIRLYIALGDAPDEDDLGGGDGVGYGDTPAAARRDLISDWRNTDSVLDWGRRKVKYLRECAAKARIVEIVTMGDAQPDIEEALLALTDGGSLAKTLIKGVLEKGATR